MEKNITLGLLAGALVGAAAAVATLPQWQHLVPASGTLASYAACIERFQDMNDNGVMAQKSCKAQHVKKLRYGEATHFKGGISQDFFTFSVSAEPGDTQDYERVEGTIEVRVDGEITKEYPFSAISEGAHPGVRLVGKIEDGAVLRGIKWCDTDEQAERCLGWTVGNLYGLTHK